MFDKANEAYFFSHDESSRQKTALISVLHTADFLASKVEYDMWKNNGGNAQPKLRKQIHQQVRELIPQQDYQTYLKIYNMNINPTIFT